MNVKKLTLGSLIVMGALVLSATAFAGPNDAAKCTYQPEQCKTIKKPAVKGVSTTNLATNPSTTNIASASSGLPFTGSDVTLLIAGGLVFGLVGFGMRRATRGESHR